MSTLLILSVSFGLLFIVTICKAARECARINEGDYPPRVPRRRVRPGKRQPAAFLRLNPTLFV